MYTAVVLSALLLLGCHHVGGQPAPGPKAPGK